MVAIDLRRDPFPERQPGWSPSGPPGGSSEGPPAWLDERLFDRRIVVVRGRLESAIANQVAGALLVLDMAGIEPIQLYLSAPDGELAAAFAVVDAIDAVRAP